jgi:DNA-binding GntR family transcriptional regulator
MVVQQIGERQIRMHNRIIKALEEHDLEGARQAILNEVNPSQEAILDTVMEESFDHMERDRMTI